MIEPFDVNPRLGVGARVVTGPFAERAFLLDDRNDVAFDDDLGVGWNRQAGIRSSIISKGSPRKPPMNSYSGKAVGHFNAAGEESQWIMAERHGDF